MALTSLLCSVAVLAAMLAYPEKYAVLVDAVSARHDANFRNVQAAMLRSSPVAATAPEQQILHHHQQQLQQAKGLIVEVPAVSTVASQQESASTDTPPEVSAAAQLAQDLIREEKRELREQHHKSMSEETDTAVSGTVSDDAKALGGGTSATGPKRGRKQKHKRRPIAMLDPRKTWQAFLRHTERQQAEQDEKKRKRTHKKVNSSRLRTRLRSNDEVHLARVDGIKNTVSRQVMIEHLRDLIRDATERGISHVDEKCGANSTKPECLERRNPAGSPLFEIERAALIPETHSAFTWQLSHKTKIRRQRELELKDFYRPFTNGALERGDGLHADEGRFTAPTGGVFVFHANVHFNASISSSASAAATSNANAGEGVVTLKLCIDSNCAGNFALSAMRTITPTEGVFTLTLGGPLHLTTGQSVSLFVANKSRQTAIRVLENSTFSGFMTSYY